MIIKGRNNSYRCQYAHYGWSYGSVKISVKKSFFGLFSYWSQVHEYTNSIGYYVFERATPDKLRKIFNKAVNTYEDYTDAWELENTN